MPFIAGAACAIEREAMRYARGIADHVDAAGARARRAAKRASIYALSLLASRLGDIMRIFSDDFDVGCLSSIMADAPIATRCGMRNASAAVKFRRGPVARPKARRRAARFNDSITRADAYVAACRRHRLSNQLARVYVADASRGATIASLMRRRRNAARRRADDVYRCHCDACRHSQGR